MTWHAISGFRLVTADPLRLVAFYDALGLASGPAERIPNEEMHLLGLGGTGERRRLTLGGSRLDLDTFSECGDPYPAAATAADLIFQHLAFVTDDVGAAWARVQSAGGIPISRDGPVTLPPSSGSVTAVKFRDPDGHPLELIQFVGARNGVWSSQGIIGIDHSAIAVSDVEISCRFYLEQGMTDGDATLNHGPTQVALDGLDGVRVKVVPLSPAATPPHLELLGYTVPRCRPQRPLSANDIAATRITWQTGREALVRDPDGHLHQLTR